VGRGQGSDWTRVSSEQKIGCMKPAYAIVALVVTLVGGCAEQKSAPEPQTGPPGVDIEYRDRDDAADSRSDATDSSETAAKKAVSDEDATGKPETKSSSPPAKKSCKGLKKGDCQVTVGCAWSTDKVCVEQ
jgi:hypothetical protein